MARKSTSAPAPPEPPAPGPQSRPRVDVADRKVQTAIRTARQLTKERDALNDKIKECERKIKEAMGDAEEAYVGGKLMAKWTTAIRQSLSATLVKKQHPEIVAECTVLTQVRTFKLVDPDA